MGKKALLTYGLPDLEGKDKKNPLDFERFCEQNLNFMEEILGKEGYDLKIIPFKNYSFYDNSFFVGGDSLLFYYSGHGNECGTICKNHMSLDSLFLGLEFLGKDRIIILDACTGENLKNKKTFDSTKVIGAEKVPYSTSIAKLLHEAVIYRGKNLKEVNQGVFNEMKHHWIYVNS